MSKSKIYYFLFFAVFMLAVKPFLGFNAVRHNIICQHPGIFVKAFTKRKQEFVENSAFDIATLKKRLANPLLALCILFSVLLNTLFPAIFKRLQQVTAGLLSHINLSLFPPLQLYLLSGKLTI